MIHEETDFVGTFDSNESFWVLFKKIPDQTRFKWFNEKMPRDIHSQRIKKLQILQNFENINVYAYLQITQIVVWKFCSFWNEAEMRQKH